MANYEVTLRSGRSVGVTAFGNPDAMRVAVMCHPAPGASTFDPDPTVSTRGPAHILAMDRPGYGASEPLGEGEWPSIARLADDIADHIRQSDESGRANDLRELDTVGAIGWSAGGRVALALAARHPTLVDRVVVVATPAPNEAVEWIPPQLQALSDELSALPASEAVAKLSAAYLELTDGALPGHGDAPIRFDELGVAAADAGALDRPGVRNRLEEMLREAYRQGEVGVVTDILSYTAADWGFDPADVEAEVLLVYGADDALITPEHGEWYRSQLPNATLEVVPDAGHLVVVPAWQRILDHVGG